MTQGRIVVKGVRVLPSKWLVAEVLKGRNELESAALKRAASALSAATGCYPSSAPQRNWSGASSPREVLDDQDETDRAARPWVHYSMFKRTP